MMAAEQTTPHNWIEEEFATLDLGDKRLDKRGKKLIKRLSEKPQASIPQACESWAETSAAYRFLDNDEVTWEGIMEPHWQKALERARAHPVVLCIQDTTELDFNGQQIKGLGPLSYESQRGMYLHPSYLVTPDRQPLGAVDAWMWTREFKDPETGERPGINESTRWVEGYERLAELAPQSPETRFVYLADREGDIGPLMARAQELGTPADWLIRAKHNRCLPDKTKLWERTLAGTALGPIVFKMPSRKGEKARMVEQTVWAQRIEFKANKSKTIQATCIIAKETNPPAGCKAVEWRLLTNRLVNSLEEAIELIEWYRCRWEIEIFFDVLKNGCKIESLQLGTVEGVQRALALNMVIAWRVVFLMRAGRTVPDLPAELFFHAEEIHACYLLNKKPRPETMPTVNEVVRLTAKLGGFLGRKGDKEPGHATLWEGLQKIYVAVITIQVLRDQHQLVDSCV